MSDVRTAVDEDPATDSGRNEPDWAALRADFPATGRFSYLALANKALLPRRVADAMAEWLGDVDTNAGQTAFSMDPIEECRATVARIIFAERLFSVWTRTDRGAGTS